MEKKMLKSIFAAACEKADVCASASPNCRKPLPYNHYMRSIPARRWIDCSGYKRTMGLQFIKEFGTYMLPQCPCCGLDLVAYLQGGVTSRQKIN